MSDLADNTAQVTHQPNDDDSNSTPDLVVIQRAQQYIGPLPHLKCLLNMGKLSRIFMNGFFKRFEEEGTHRAAMAKEMWAFQHRGQWMALSMGLFALACYNDDDNDDHFCQYGSILSQQITRWYYILRWCYLFP